MRSIDANQIRCHIRTAFPQLVATSARSTSKRDGVSGLVIVPRENLPSLSSVVPAGPCLQAASTLVKRPVRQANHFLVILDLRVGRSCISHCQVIGLPIEHGPTRSMHRRTEQRPGMSSSDLIVQVGSALDLLFESFAGYTCPFRSSERSGAVEGVTRYSGPKARSRHRCSCQWFRSSDWLPKHGRRGSLFFLLAFSCSSTLQQTL